jgi:hypothetical protein
MPSLVQQEWWWTEKGRAPEWNRVSQSVDSHRVPAARDQAEEKPDAYQPVQ